MANDIEKIIRSSTCRLKRFHDGWRLSSVLNVLLIGGSGLFSGLAIFIDRQGEGEREREREKEVVRQGGTRQIRLAEHGCDPLRR